MAPSGSLTSRNGRPWWAAKLLCDSRVSAEMPTSTENWHPWELKGKHAEMLCNRCHKPGIRPNKDCATCHKFDAKAPMMDGGCDNCHLKEQEVKPLADCKSCHDGLPGLHTKGGHPDAACTDCHKPHVWKTSGAPKAR